MDDQENELRRGTRVCTPDGVGRIVGRAMRRNTSGGPGARQYVVKLDDGRTRHYKQSETKKDV